MDTTHAPSDEWAWFDAPEAQHEPVAWSRQGLLAHGVCDEHGAHVALLGDTGRAIHDTPLLRLFPPSRTPALGDALPTQLGAPTLLRFSPCGYTLLAYFPAEASAPRAPEASTSAVQIPPSVLPAMPPTPLQPTPTATPASSATLAPVPDHMSPAPTLPSAAVSPALTPTPATPHAWEAIQTLPLSPPTVVQSDQGVVCVWIRAPHAPLDRFALHQWVPVAYDASGVGCIHGDVIDALWLGAPRLWKMDGSTFVREPACGPATFGPNGSPSLNEPQREQACVLVTRAGQVVWLHRLSSAMTAWHAFRVHYGCVSLASIMPPPPTLDAEQAPDPSASSRAVRRARLVAVPNESVILLAYEPASCAHDLVEVRLTELQIQLDGEMSFCVVHPLPSVPWNVGSTALTRRRATFEWVPTSSSLSLWLCCSEAPLAPASRSERTCLSAYVARRATTRTQEAWPSLSDASSETLDTSQERWTLSITEPSVVHGVIVTSLVPPQQPLPYHDAVWATAWDASCHAEVWGTLDAHSGTFVRLSDPLPPRWLTRTSWALSPNGVLACTHLWPSGRLACAPLPVSLRAPSDAGHLFALALLRHTMHTDVAHAMHTASPITYVHLVATMQATAKALQWTRDQGRQGLSLTQTMQLVPVALSLVSGTQETSQRQLYDRLALLAQWADMHRQLCAARTDAGNTPLAWLATEAHPAVSFAPAHAWSLAHALRRALTWLEQSASVGVQCQVPGARASDVPSDSLLELLAHTGACHLVHEVLAGLLVHATWLEQVPPATFASLALREVRAPTDAQYDAAVRHHAQVRDYVTALLARTPVNVLHIMEGLGHAPYDVDAPRFWNSLLGARDAHLSDAAFYLGRTLLGASLSDEAPLCTQHMRVVV